jgi:hypothetical protein
MMIEEKIENLKTETPFVWQLQITKEEFEALQNDLLTAQQRQDDLTSPVWARKAIVFLAEWYHRCYAAGMASPLSFTEKEWERLWTNAGLAAEVFVYRDSQSNRRWLYSTYVLGGLAIRHELGRNDNGRFLKALCRLYHGENYTLENLDDASRAVAFKESILRRHSLYVYLQALLNGNMDTMAQGDDELETFLVALRHANDEVLRQKFRTEWIFNYRQGAPAITRVLRLWLKPEEIGEGLNQYLRYDRVRLWGFEHPETVRSLAFSIRFLKGNEIVSKENWAHPAIVFSNTGQADTGFVSWGIEQYAVIKDVPTRDFDKLQIMVIDDAGHDFVAQEITARKWLQLWRVDDYGTSWSSRQQSQRPTAVLASKDCVFDNEAMIEFITLKHANRRIKETSSGWQWVPIYDSVSFVDGQGNPVTLYNRNGYDQLTTRRYPEIFCYQMGGMIRYRLLDEDGQANETSESHLPLIFGKGDLLVRHFETKDAIIDAKADKEEAADIVEWKADNGRYVAWTPESRPPYGIITVRVMVKGIAYTQKVIYLRGIREGQPVCRNLQEHKIAYIDNLNDTEDVDDESVKEKVDKVVLGNEPLSPVLTIELTDRHCQYLLDVWRPLQLNEICVDGKVMSRYEGEFMLPYILKDKVVYNEFSERGYISYPCSRLGNIYQLTGTGTGAAMKAWENEACWPARQLDSNAPESLKVGLGRSHPNGDEPLKWYRWDYYSDSEPQETGYQKEPVKNTILFQSMKALDSQLDDFYPVIKWTPFGFHRERVSLVRCFEIAVGHGLYFFMLKPLADLHNEDELEEKLVKPLKEARGGQLTTSDTRELQRLRTELGINNN